MTCPYSGKAALGILHIMEKAVLEGGVTPQRACKKELVYNENLTVGDKRGNAKEIVNW